MPDFNRTVNLERDALVFSYSENLRYVNGNLYIGGVIPRTPPPADTWQDVDDDLDLSWPLPSGNLIEVCWDGQYYVTMWNGVTRSFAGFRTQFQTRTEAARAVEAAVQGRPDVYR